MEVYECVRSRLTVRDFKPDPVPGRIITKLLQAARWAPSSRNRQPWQFIVIRDRGTLEQIGRIASSGPYISQAPLAIAVAMENVNRSELDAGRAVQQLELTAWSQGLGTCFVGLRDQEQTQIKELLGIPQDLRLMTVLPLGYPTESARAGSKLRKPLSEIAHREQFGQKYVTG